MSQKKDKGWNSILCLFFFNERKTRLELATFGLGSQRSTN